MSGRDLYKRGEEMSGDPKAYQKAIDALHTMVNEPMLVEEGPTAHSRVEKSSDDPAAVRGVPPTTKNFKEPPWAT